MSEEMGHFSHFALADKSLISEQIGEGFKWRVTGSSELAHVVFSRALTP